MDDIKVENFSQIIAKFRQFNFNLKLPRCVGRIQVSLLSNLLKPFEAKKQKKHFWKHRNAVLGRKIQIAFGQIPFLWIIQQNYFWKSLSAEKRVLNILWVKEYILFGRVGG